MHPHAFNFRQRPPLNTAFLPQHNNTTQNQKDNKSFSKGKNRYQKRKPNQIQEIHEENVEEEEEEKETDCNAETTFNEDAHIDGFNEIFEREEEQQQQINHFIEGEADSYDSIDWNQHQNNIFL